ncbi:MAG TPA: condensation domain-containing protein [Pyrinomonadaceae bacterium]|jgi:non-ribosomal peptide synthetase component F
MNELSKRIAGLTPAQFALIKQRLNEKSQGRPDDQAIPRRVARFATHAPLSFSQERLWFLYQLEPKTYAFNVTNAVRLIGRLNVAALENALNEIVRRHEALRTIFANIEGEPVQIIAPELQIRLRVVDLRHRPGQQREDEAVGLITFEARKPFDLTNGSLLRTLLVQLDDNQHVALLVMHHIVSDGWSMGVLVRELCALYSAYAANQPSKLPALSVQYADFTTWQRERLSGDRLDELLAYWKKQLGADLPVLELPIDRPRPATPTFKGAVQPFTVSPALSESLEKLSKHEGATMFMTLLAAIQFLLQRYTNQDDIPIGVNIANRTRRDIEGLIGFFVNNLVLRGDLSGNPTFRELLRRSREVTLGAYAHQELPFEMLVDALRRERGSNSSLFQVMFVMQNTPAAALELPGLKLEPFAVSDEQSAFDLTFFTKQTDEGIVGWLEYNSDLFNATTISQMLERFQLLLGEIAANPDQRIENYSTEPDESAELIGAFNLALE